MKKILFALVVFLALLGLTTVFIVDETEQVVILAFGKPVRTITEPGINMKVPFPSRKKSSLMTVFWNMTLHRKKY